MIEFKGNNLKKMYFIKIFNQIKLYKYAKHNQLRKVIFNKILKIL